MSTVLIAALAIRQYKIESIVTRSVQPTANLA